MPSIINHKNDSINLGDETSQAINVSVANEYKQRVINFPLSIVHNYIVATNAVF